MSGPLDHSPADIIGQLLIQAGKASAHNGIGWPTFVNTNPANNVQCLSVGDTTGVIRGKTHVDGEAQEHYGVQILARSPSPVLPFRKLNELLVFLSNVSRIVVALEDAQYTVIATTITSPVLRLGREQPEDVLTVCSLNMLCSIQQSLGEES